MKIWLTLRTCRRLFKSSEETILTVKSPVRLAIVFQKGYNMLYRWRGSTCFHHIFNSVLYVILYCIVVAIVVSVKLNFIKKANKDNTDILVWQTGIIFLCVCVFVFIKREGKATSLLCELTQKSSMPTIWMCELQTVIHIYTIRLKYSALSISVVRSFVHSLVELNEFLIYSNMCWDTYERIAPGSMMEKGRESEYEHWNRCAP